MSDNIACDVKLGLTRSIVLQKFPGWTTSPRTTTRAAIRAGLRRQLTNLPCVNLGLNEGVNENLPACCNCHLPPCDSCHLPPCCNCNYLHADCSGLEATCRGAAAAAAGRSTGKARGRQEQDARGQSFGCSASVDASKARIKLP